MGTAFIASSNILVSIFKIGNDIKNQLAVFRWQQIGALNPRAIWLVP